MMRRIIKILISGGLLVYVIYTTELWTAQGLEKLAEAFSNANLLLLLIALSYILLIDLVSSFKWYCLSKALALKSRLIDLFRFYLIGRFFNLILPSNIGGDLIRIHLQGKQCNSYAHSAAIVFLERMTGMITLIVLAFMISLFMPGSFELPWLSSALGASVIGLAIILYLVADHRPLSLLRSPIESRFAISRTFFNKLEKFRHSLFLFKHNPSSIVIAFINSVNFYLFAIANVWVSALVFDTNIQFIDMLIGVPLIMLIMNLPISIGGIGLMEFAYTLVLTFMGIAPEIAVSTVLLMRFKTFLSAGIGYLLYIGIDSRHQQTPLTQEVQTLAAKSRLNSSPK